MLSFVHIGSIKESLVDDGGLRGNNGMPAYSLNKRRRWLISEQMKAHLSHMKSGDDGEYGRTVVVERAVALKSINTCKLVIDSGSQYRPLKVAKSW